LNETSTERTPSYVKYGEVHFTIDGQALKLNVYRNIELSKKKEFKIIFSYRFRISVQVMKVTGGKYIDLKYPKATRLQLISILRTTLLRL
jgi:hypothetical protein